MGKPTGFMEHTRELPARRPVAERVNDFREVYQDFPEQKLRLQGARCMDCGVPFCHTGCPLNNVIPDWNDLVYRDRWREAVRPSTPPIISPNSPGAFARRPARLLVFWVLTALL